MARMMNDDLLRQLGLIEDALRRIRSLVFSVKIAQSRPELQANARKGIENLSNECNSLVALFGNFVASLKEISGECEARLAWFRTLSKRQQEKHLTEYGGSKVEYLLGTAGTHAKELMGIVSSLSQNLLKAAARLKQEDISLVNELSQDLERSVIIHIAALTKGIADDFAQAVELQNALASETKAKPAGASLFSRLFGFRPAAT